MLFCQNNLDSQTLKICRLFGFKATSCPHFTKHFFFSTSLAFCHSNSFFSCASSSLRNDTKHFTDGKANFLSCLLRQTARHFFLFEFSVLKLPFLNIYASFSPKKYLVDIRESNFLVFLQNFDLSFSLCLCFYSTTLTVSVLQKPYFLGKRQIFL